MNKEKAILLQRFAMVLIITVMCTDHFLFDIEEGFILACAIVSTVLLAVTMVKLKIIETKEKLNEIK